MGIESMGKATKTPECSGKDYKGVESMGFEEAGKQITDKLVKAKEFYETPKDQNEPTPDPAWIARYKGDNIEGILLSGPHTHHRRNSSYRLQITENSERVQEGRVWMIFGNKQLHVIFRDNNLVGSGKRIRIEYIGRERQNWGGRPRKVYRVFVDDGKIFKKEREVKT